MTDLNPGRILWIDYTKAIAIFCVVWLHVHSCAEVSIAINSFVMPLFFMVSGYLFSFKRNPVFSTFFYKRFRQIIIPYLWINAIAYFCWTTVLRHYGSDLSDDIGWQYPLAGIFVGVPKWLCHDVPLWSLISIFTCEIAFYLLRKTGISASAICISGFAAAFLLSSLWPDIGGFIPFAIGPSFAGIAFYASGNILRKSAFNNNCQIRKLENPFIILLLICIWALCTYHNEMVEFFICRYGNFTLFVMSAYAGSMCIVGISSVCARTFGVLKTVKIISVGTLLICGFHNLVFSGMKGIALFCVGLNPETLTEGFFNGLIFALIAFMLCVPIILITDRYLSFLVDKK